LHRVDDRALRAARRELGIIRAARSESCSNTVRAPVISPSERVALCVALALLALQAVTPGDGLEYRRSVLAAEPWRALTAHLVHVGWAHALVNAAALWVVARLYADDLDAPRQVVALVVCALVVSAVLAWAYPSIEWYRGLSGALHGLYFAGAVKWLLAERPRTLARLWIPAALVAGGWIKVLVEQPGGAMTPHADWLGAPVVPQAHLAGALAGSALGALFAAAQPRAEQQGAEQ
jgi:rhomboid family GlyGly-CTERM serine protease